MIVCTLLYGCEQDKHEKCLQAPTEQCLMDTAFELSGAMDWTRQELEDDKDKQDVMVQLVNAHAVLGYFDNAIELMERIPDDCESYRYYVLEIIIDHLAYSGDMLRAKEVLSKYADDSVYCYVRGLTTMAEVQTELGDQITATALLEEAIETLTSSQLQLRIQSSILFQMAYFHKNLDELDARRLMRLGVSITPGTPGRQAKIVPYLAELDISEARAALEMARSSLYIGRAGCGIYALHFFVAAEVAVGDLLSARETVRYMKEAMDFIYDQGEKDRFYWGWYLPALIKIGEIETALNLAEATGDEEQIDRFFWRYYLPALAEIGKIETALNLAEATGDEEQIDRFFWWDYLPALAEIGEFETAPNLAEATDGEEQIESLKSIITRILSEQGDIDRLIRYDHSIDTLIAIIDKSLYLGEEADVIVQQFEQFNNKQLDDFTKRFFITLNVGFVLSSWGHILEAQKLVQDVITDINKIDDVNEQVKAYIGLALIFQEIENQKQGSEIALVGTS